MARCPARIFHGPGHQSSTQCEYEEGHDDNHYCVYGEFRQEAEWFGGFPGEVPEVFTGFADEPPVFPYLTGSESLAGVTLEEKWYALHEDWRPRLKSKCNCAFDVSWEHNSNCPEYDGPRKSEATIIAELLKSPAQAAYDRLVKNGPVNFSNAPDWFHDAVQEAVREAVMQEFRYHCWSAAKATNTVWAALQANIKDLT